jgi:hypothetical protein
MALLATVLALDITAATTNSARLGAVANVMAFVAAVGASNLGFLDHLLLFGAELHAVANLLAVGAVGLQAVHGEASILQTLKVLLSTLGPAFSENGTARLESLLERDLVLLVGIALEIDVGVNLGRNGLLLGDEVVLEVSLAEALLKLDEGELRSELAVGPEGLNEVVDVAIVIGGVEVLPSLIGIGGVRNTFRVDVVLLGTSSSGMTSAGASLANGVNTLGGAVTFSTASAAGASESTLGTRVGAIGLVVSSLTTVEALAGVLTGLRALAREVTRLATAVSVLVMRKTGQCGFGSLATSIISGTAIVLGDGLRVHARVFGVNACSGSGLDPVGGVGAGGRLLPARSYKLC